MSRLYLVCAVCACDFLIKMSAYNPDNLWLANKIILWDFLFSVLVSMVSFLSKNIPLRKQCKRDDGRSQFLAGLVSVSLQIEYHNGKQGKPTNQ